MKHADKGVFITTSFFTKDARQARESCSKKIVLIDGPELAKYMISYDVGVATEYSIPIKKLDVDFFQE